MKKKLKSHTTALRLCKIAKSRNTQKCMHVLIVGGDDFISTSRNVLQEYGATVHSCKPSQSALARAYYSRPDVVFIDTSADIKSSFLDGFLADLKDWNIDPMLVGITTAGAGCEVKSGLYRRGFDLVSSLG